MAIIAVTAIEFVSAAPEVTDITAKQRYPWNGLVDIACNVSGIEADAGGYEFAVVAVDKDTGKEYTVSNFSVKHSGEDVTGLDVYENGDYSLLWNAREDMGQVVIGRMAVRITLEALAVSVGKVQLWEGGPYWADRNIGADNPWDSGLYFWWGDIIGCKRVGDAWMAGNSSSSHGSFAGDNTPTFNQKTTAILQSDGWITADFILTPRRDAAHVQWGGGWRMPTHQELTALSSNCDWTWTTINGVNGYIIRGRGNYISNSIFFPCTGYGYKTSLEYPETGCYWSSGAQNPSSYSAKLWIAYELRFNLGWHGTTNAQCYEGKPIRPVQ